MGYIKIKVIFDCNNSFLCQQFVSLVYSRSSLHIFSSSSGKFGNKWVNDAGSED